MRVSAWMVVYLLRKYIGIVNCCGIVNKHLEIQDLLLSQNIDILLCTETHLEDSISDSEVFLPNYSVYRKDRNRQGGGVSIAIRSDLPSCQLDTVPNLEIIWVQLHFISFNDIILGCFYRPPNSPLSMQNDLRNSLQQIRSQFPGAKIILGGDFNCPGVDWSTGTLTESYVSLTQWETLITTMDDCLMQQVVTFPTRRSNILDLCFTTDPDLVQSCQPFAGKSDHDTVLLKFKLRTILLDASQKKDLPL